MGKGVKSGQFQKLPGKSRMAAIYRGGGPKARIRTEEGMARVCEARTRWLLRRGSDWSAASFGLVSSLGPMRRVHVCEGVSEEHPRGVSCEPVGMRVDRGLGPIRRRHAKLGPIRRCHVEASHARDDVSEVTQRNFSVLGIFLVFRAKTSKIHNFRIRALFLTFFISTHR